jgi:hypothetical protein
MRNSKAQRYGRGGRVVQEAIWEFPEARQRL